MKAKGRWGLLLLQLLAATALAQRLPLVTLHYYERPPFMTRQANGIVGGLTADRARRAFQRAAIPFRWALTPAKRQLELLRANRGQDCALGWFRSPQRQAYALFSAPLYQDKGVVMIARRGLALKPGTTLAQLLADGQLHLLYKDGLSYGREVQDKLGMAKADINYTTMEQSQLLRMVAAGRAEAMFATGEEAALLLDSAGAGAEALQLLAFPDARGGDARYLMCSRQLGTALMQRLDAAIAAEGGAAAGAGGSN